MHDEEFSRPVAFLTWLACAVGICGVHRFYLGQTGMGLLYLFTGGLFGIGQLVDLVRMNTLVEDANLKKELKGMRRHRALGALGETGYSGKRGVHQGAMQHALPAQTRMSESEMRLALTRCAAENKGELSVTQGVIATGHTFKEVEVELDKMASSGYVSIDNHPDSGVVIYVFRELVS